MLHVYTVIMGTPILYVHNIMWKAWYMFTIKTNYINHFYQGWHGLVISSEMAFGYKWKQFS